MNRERLRAALTTDERSLLALCLNIAADQFDRDAAEAQAAIDALKQGEGPLFFAKQHALVEHVPVIPSTLGFERIRDQFRRQARQARGLLDEIEL